MSEKTDCRDGFYLDDWYVHPRTGRLSRGEFSSRLEPKIMEVLVLLAENYPSFVPRDLFFETVWHDVNVVEHVLPRAISEIRRELSDDPREPHVIETLPKIGYKLLTPPALTPLSTGVHFTTQLDPPRKIFPNAAAFVGGILTVVVIVIGLLVVSGLSHQH